MTHQDWREQARRSDDVPTPNSLETRQRADDRGQESAGLESSDERAPGAGQPPSIAPTALTPASPDKTFPDSSAVFLRVAALGLIGAAAVVAAIYAGNGRQAPGTAATRVSAPMTFAGTGLQEEIRQLQRSYSESNDRLASWRGHSGMFTAFDMAEAETALTEVQQQSSACAVEPVSKSTDIEVHVVIGRSGQAVYAHTPDRDILGDEVANCVESRFRTVVISPFEGQDVSLTRRFAISQ